MVIRHMYYDYYYYIIVYAPKFFSYKFGIVNATAVTNVSRRKRARKKGLSSTVQETHK